MKILWLFITLTLNIVVQNSYSNNTDIYVSILGTVVMNCRFESNSKTATFRWRREGTTIAQRFVLMSDFASNRFQIIGDENKGVYNLKIMNITKEDLGQYLCETQVSSKITATYYILKLIEDTSSAQDNILTGASREFTSTTSDETRKVTGQLLRENFYYGLLAGGLVLVLCMSILCTAGINIKRKIVVIKPTENVLQDNLVNTQVNHTEHIATYENDVEVYKSQYETIRESEMLPQHKLSVITDVAKKPKQSFSTFNKLSLEDNAEQNKSRETGESSDDGDDITRSNTDSYLHPYANLNSNDMEYLNSYSIVINVDKVISVESLL